MNDRSNERTNDRTNDQTNTYNIVFGNKNFEESLSGKRPCSKCGWNYTIKEQECPKCKHIDWTDYQDDNQKYINKKSYQVKNCIKCGMEFNQLKPYHDQCIKCHVPIRNYLWKNVEQQRKYEVKDF